MVTTNIDSVAEFKILTNSYQAEYGRAVGGQMQVVTKSGTQNFHGSGYWYGRRSGWDANTWLNDRNTPAIPKPDTSRNDSGYTIGGPVAFPGFNSSKTKLFFFWSQEWQRRTDPTVAPPDDGPNGARAAGGLLAERRQQRPSVSVHPGRHHRTAVRSGQHERMLPGRRGARQNPGEPALRSRPCGAEHLSVCELLRRQRPELHEPGARQLAAPGRSASDGLPGGQQLAHHRPLHEEQRGHHAGVRDDVGRQRQRPAPDTSAVPSPRLQLHAVGDRHPEQHDLARGELGARRQLAELPAAAAGACSAKMPASKVCRCCSRMPCSPTTSRG